MENSNGWSILRIADAPIEIEDGDRGKNYPKQADFTLSGYCLFLNAGNVTLDGFRFDDCKFISSEKDNKLRKGKLLREDLVMTTRGTVGNVAYYDESVPYDHIRINSGMVIFRPETDSLLPLFLYQYLRSKAFKDQVHALRTGSAQPQLPIRDINRIEIPLPPLPQQEAIAAILGALDDKIELNRRMNETLEAMARAIFKSWFVDFDPVRAKLDGRHPPGMDADTAALFPDSFEHVDGELVPEGWRPTTLGEEIDFQTGFAFKSKHFSESPPGIRLARGMNVKEGEFFWGNQSRYWPEVTPGIEEYLLQKGDVLIGMDGSKVGKNWVRVRESDLPCLLVQRVARLRQAESIGENFVWLIVSDPEFRFYVDAVKTGTSIPHISGGQIKNYDFIRPPIGENKLFEGFESLVAPLTEQADNNHAESQTLAETRDALLPKLLSGEIRVADAEIIAEGVV
ncbi:MAG: restriction endonuclease subunit S [Planctomycetaceae bacterium]|nr:restriction endonuclease subunit S [Planctomycetaceae bacterium]